VLLNTILIYDIHMFVFFRKVPGTEKGSHFLHELDESALKDLDELCMILSHKDSNDVSVTMDVT